MDPRVGEPLLFGMDGEPLFGCLHTPSSTPVTAAALLLPAAGHEYLSSHRSLRQLALRLAERGCLALRMDFRGCGDSSGAQDSGGLAHWRDDAEQGLQLLAARAPGARLHVLGLRLGASIAAQVGAQRAAAQRPLAAVALWDPVMAGDDYLRAALRLQMSRHSMRQQAADPGPFEVLGHRWSRSLVAELRALVVADLRPAPAARLLLVDTCKAYGEALGAAWRALGADFEYRAIEAPDLWAGDGQVALIATGVVQAMVDWLVPV